MSKKKGSNVILDQPTHGDTPFYNESWFNEN